MGRLINLGLVVLIVLVGLALAAANDVPVRINLFFTSFELPLSQGLALALACGVALGVLVSLPLLLRAKFELARLRRALRRKADDTLTSKQNAR